MKLKKKLEKGPAIVEQYSRWQVLAWIMTFRAVSRPLHDKYPDLESLQAAGEIDKRLLWLQKVT